MANTSSLAGSGRNLHPTADRRLPDPGRTPEQAQRSPGPETEGTLRVQAERSDPDQRSVLAEDDDVQGQAVPEVLPPEPLPVERLIDAGTGERAELFPLFAERCEVRLALDDLDGRRR